jgi:hypothetical protein
MLDYLLLSTYVILFQTVIPETYVNGSYIYGC